MDILRYSTDWVRGEIFEMVFIAIAGIVLTSGAIAFAKFGATPLARAMFVLLTVIGIFYSSLGAAGYVVNQQRLPAFERASNENAAAFIAAEKKRVEEFQFGYTVTNIVAPLCFALAACLFWFSLNPHARALGIALIVFGLFGFFIDGFSKERADIYYAKIQEALSHRGAAQS